MSFVCYERKGLYICPDAGCYNCEHAEPHEVDDCESSCFGGGDYDCPACIPYEEFKNIGPTPK